MSIGTQPSSSHILWQNEDRTITLIDIPCSISSSQSTPESPCDSLLLSSKPSRTPFPSNEPKTAAARAKLGGNAVDDERHALYAHLLEHASAEISAHHSGDWCLPRLVDINTHLSASAKRQKLTHPEQQSGSNERSGRSLPSDRDREDLPLDYFEHLVSKDLLSAHIILQSSPSCAECDAGDVRLQSNCSSHATELRIVECKASNNDDRIDAMQSFRVPPKSTFALMNCSESRLFHAFVRNHAQAHGTRRHFDLVLLDPPWPNRSVRRTHRSPGTSYSTVSTLAGVQALILGTDLDMLMSDRCLVGVWITNKPAARELVLGENGIFANWGVVLQEEWIWLKTTTHGQPVSPVDSSWRKPYEVFLLGRRSVSHAPVAVPADGGQHPGLSTPRRRVLVAVPDLHSRKPCLKGLVDLLLPNQEHPRILEVFARNLVAGWWSWGDECIKFNWTGYWSRAAAATDNPNR